MEFLCDLADYELTSISQWVKDLWHRLAAAALILTSICLIWPKTKKAGRKE